MRHDNGNFGLGVLIGACAAILVIGTFVLYFTPIPVNQDKIQIDIGKQLGTVDVAILSTSGNDPLTVNFTSGNKPMLAICTKKAGNEVTCKLFSPFPADTK